MGRKKLQQEDCIIKRITLAGTVSLFLLLLLFLIFTVSRIRNLVSQVELIAEHPFTVNGDVSEIRKNLALMRIRTERLQAYNQPEDIELVRLSLEELYIEMEKVLAEVETLYLGPEEDTVALRATYEEIQQAHQLFLEFSRKKSSTTEVIAEYEKEYLYPLYEKFDEDAVRIRSFVRATQQSIFDSAERMSHTTVIWSCIISASIIIGLIFFQWTIRRMNQRLYQKNRQFEVLSDTIDETFFIFEEGSKQCEFVSGNAERILGIPQESLRENRGLFYENMTKETAEEISNEIYTEGRIAWNKEVEYHSPQSTEPRWLHIRSYRIEENGSTRYVMTLMDRTEERRANQALEDALESAQKANNAKKDFLSRMSHEIRTPMNAIIGMSSIAAASIDDHVKVADCLEKIGHSSKHLLMLINDVLDMSRLESNRLSINAEPFDLFQFMNTFVSVVHPQATAKKLDFQEKLVGFSEHTTYIGDSLRLNQILLNLLSNAIKFTPAGGKVNLEVTNLKARGNKSWMRFVVSDTGIGMDEQGLSKLYIPFEQANESIAGKYGGTGLGMPITQNLVSLMGGYIHAESKLGEGTTFTVELPFQQSEVDLETCLNPKLENMEVLVVDDEQDICEHAVLLLEKMKIHAEWVLSGKDAVDRVISARESGAGYDVCFIDWKMPDMDGVETTRRIRQAVGPETPIIIISAYDWSDIEEEARVAGVNAFIAKPMFQTSIYNALMSVSNTAMERKHKRENEKEHPLEGKRLLMAEDNALNMEIMVTLLEMNGAQVECAQNGKEVVEHFLSKEPGYFDAILMDIQMPVMDGCEAARQIRSGTHSDAGRIPIIATTANAFTEDVATVMAAGMNAHIGKPFDITQLCDILSRLCEENIENTKFTGTERQGKSENS